MAHCHSTARVSIADTAVADHKRHRRNREPSLERDARRKAKKEARRHSKQSGAFGYTDDANPFGDPSLSKVFVWKKKHKAELDAG